MNKAINIKKTVQKRLEFIEFSLFWVGGIGRKQIQYQFAISLQQATKDLNFYLELAPTNMLYDPKRKTYVPTNLFKPIFIKANSSEYLSILDALTVNHIDAHEVWIPNIPSYRGISIPSRDVSSNVLKKVLHAIDANLSFEMKYTSLSTGSEKARRVSPHALGSDGNRWHMRAYNHERNRYSDFVLSRIESIQNFESSTSNPHDDFEWHDEITLKLLPDPSLSEDQQMSIGREYNMEETKLQIKTSKAMLFYHLRRFGFNPWPSKGKTMRNESSYQLYIENIAQVEEWLNRR